MNIVFIQLHGKIKLVKPDIGIDSDTGGQIVYVLNAAKALAKRRHQVTIITRLLSDPGYDIKEEQFNGVKLIRFSCGGNNYLRKEMLWDLLPEFADACLNYFSSKGNHPDLIIANYADAGAVGFICSRVLDVALIFIPHSLGRTKLENLLRSKRNDFQNLEKEFKFSTRIFHEEQVMRFADRVIISSEHERDFQCAQYLNFGNSAISVVPPGINFKPVHRLNKFGIERRPIVLASRFNQVKNIIGTIDQLAGSHWIRENTQVVIATTNKSLDSEAAQILSDLAMRRENLGDFIQILTLDRQEEIFQLFRFAKDRRGLFVNLALIEPFGLTTLEAASYGLPVVVTHNGGTIDVIHNLQCGKYVDIRDTEAVQRTVGEILQSDRLWEAYSKNGQSNTAIKYSWVNWAKAFETIIAKRYAEARPPKFLPRKGNLVVVSDLDGTLTGSKTGARTLKKYIETHKNIYFVIATGRTLQETVSIVAEWGLPKPELILSRVGTVMHRYSPKTEEYVFVSEWDEHLRKQHVGLPDISGPQIFPQGKEVQTLFKRSYYASGEVMKIPTCNLFCDQFGNLDLLSIRASKGLAVRWILAKAGLSTEDCIVCGDSGNDTDMMIGKIRSVIVRNHVIQDKHLEKISCAYFSKATFAEGVLEGILHYSQMSCVA